MKLLVVVVIPAWLNASQRSRCWNEFACQRVKYKTPERVLTTAYLLLLFLQQRKSTQSETETDDTADMAKRETNDADATIVKTDDTANRATSERDDAETETDKTDDIADTGKCETDEADTETGRSDDTLNTEKSEMVDADAESGKADETADMETPDTDDVDITTDKMDDIVDTEKCETDSATGKSDGAANIVASDMNEDSVQDEKSSNPGVSDKLDATDEESNTDRSPNSDGAINADRTSGEYSQKATESGPDTASTTAATDGIDGGESVEEFGSTIDGCNVTDVRGEDCVKTCVTEASGETTRQGEGEVENDSVTSTLANDTCDGLETERSTADKPDASGLGGKSSDRSTEASSSDPQNVDNPVQPGSGDIEKGEAITQEPSRDIGSTEASPQVSGVPKTNQPATADASSRNNTISTGVDSRGQDRNDAGDHRNVSGVLVFRYISMS